MVPILEILQDTATIDTQRIRCHNINSSSDASQIRNMYIYYKINADIWLYFQVGNIRGFCNRHFAVHFILLVGV